MINPEELNMDEHYSRFIEENPEFSDRVALAEELFDLDEIVEEIRRRNKEHVLRKYLAYEELVAVVLSSRSPNLHHNIKAVTPNKSLNQA